MGNINPDVLYSNLLEDLSPYLDSSQIDSFYQSGKAVWYVDSSPSQVASVSLGNSLMKKFIDRVSPNADSVCERKFRMINNQCGVWRLDLQSSGDELLLGELKSALYDFLYPGGMPLVSSFGQILGFGRSGPGASRGSIGNDFYSKMFSSPLTATSSVLYGVYADHINLYPDWLAAEEIRARKFGEVDVITGNRVSFVPKNVDTSRLICVEPSLNMFYQLGLGRLLERRLYQFFGIDMAQQPSINRVLARKGSLDLKEDDDVTKNLVTIDLSNASDSMSLKMLKEVLPPMFMGWLEILRSPVSVMPNGSEERLSMVSTMGNGFTFPLQTMLFACVVLAAARTYQSALKRGGKYRLPLNYGVFGDDIICERGIVRGVLRLLTILGFEVNSEKSFFEGPFRESCGHDYFRGQNVRGVYIKSLLTMQHRFSVINQLNLFSARHRIPLPRVVGRLRASVGHFPVPVWENDDAGIRCTYHNLEKLKWSKRYQSLIYRPWRPRPRRLTIGDGIVTVPKGEKGRIYNPSALLLAFLRGDIERGYITVRQNTVLYSTRTCVAPNWDASYTGSALPADIGLLSFGWAVWVNGALNKL